MPTSVAGNLVNGVGSSVGQVATTKILETLFGEAKISKPAQDAISAMQQRFLPDESTQDFLAPLRRTGLYLGNEPFKLNETFAYLGNKVIVNCRRLPSLMNQNLKEAATLLWDLHCKVSLHIMYRINSTLERSDADHSYVLMYLQESIAAAFEHLCTHPDLSDEDVEQLKLKIVAGIVEPFASYIHNTQSTQSSGARRTAINHNIRDTMEKVTRALDRFAVEKPLQTSIASLQQSTQGFNSILKQFLLAIVLVSRQEGEKQQETHWVLRRKMLLAQVIQGDVNGLLPSLQEEKSMSSGYRGKQGTLYTNPFAERVNQLVTTGGALSQEQCYFQYILKVFANSAKVRTSLVEEELQSIMMEFQRYYAVLTQSNSFLLRDILHQGTGESDFIQLCVLLFRQSHELARFMAALQHFMHLVGKLGLYNNPELHSQLSALLQSSFARLEHNLSQMNSYVRQGNEALVGGWLSPIDDMLQQLKRYGSCMTQEMQGFQGHFAKIIDPVAMQHEFHKTKMDLLQAALGLGLASQIDSEQMSVITQQIEHVKFDDFVVTHSSDAPDLHVHISEAFSLTEDMGQQLSDMSLEMQKIREQYAQAQRELLQLNDAFLAQREALNGDGARLQSQATQLSEHVQKAEATLAEIDQIVADFEQKIKEQLSELNAESVTDVAEANRLMESTKQTLNALSTCDLSEHMTLLSQLKGRLEERQKSYQKLVDSVSTFQAQYRAKRGGVSLALVSVQDVAKEIDKTVVQLMAKINALTDIISSLRHILEDKDKQLAAQQAKVVELEASLTMLRRGRESPSTSESGRACSYGLSDSRLSSNLSFVSTQSRPGYKMQRAIEVYETDVKHGKLVKNKNRKFIKYSIWSELNHVVCEHGKLLLRDGQELKEVKDLILAIIAQLRVNDCSLKTETSETFSFKSLVSEKTDNEVYLEFLKGDYTRETLKDLEKTFSPFLTQTTSNLFKASYAY